MKTLIAIPIWIEKSLPFTSVSDKRVLIIYPTSSEKFAQELAIFFPFYKFFSIQESTQYEKILCLFEEENFDALYFVSRQENVFIENPHHVPLLLLNIIQAFKERLSLNLKVIIQKAIKFDEATLIIHPLDSALIGLTQATGKEFPYWNVSLINIELINQETLSIILKEQGEYNQNNDPIFIHHNKRYIRGLAETELVLKDPTKFRQNGSYLIVGGGKGIGFELAKYLAKTYKAHLILIGRSEIEEKRLKELDTLGGKTSYQQIDICNFKMLKNAMDAIDSLDGVIHSALVLKDKTISHMDSSSFLDVLSPKVAGSINLFKATLHCSPSIFLFFSSFQSFIANPGQSNYSAASTFQDAWAQFIRDTYMVDARVINWSFWGNIGIVATNEYRQRMRKLEIGSIELEEGILAIESLLKSQEKQIAVIKASSKALERLYIESKNKIDTLVLALKEIVPPFISSDPSVQRNLELQKALENYSRWAIHQIVLPHNPIDKYQRLYEAIQNIPLGKPIEKESFLQHYPEIKAHIRFLDHCLEKYPDVLMGKMDHMQVLFPDGSFEFVMPIYKDNPMADYFNKVVANTVIKYAQTFSEKTLKIIEIGAGTGSTTESLLPLLNPYHTNYLFTDISLGFIRIAKQKWETLYPFLKFQTLDIEKEPQIDQLVDIVIATNVLHATRDIQQTIKHVSKLLKKDGIIIINEITDRQDFATLTFGLTSGWWLYSDFRIPNSPLISGETWEILLKEQNFLEVFRHGSGLQQVIVGRLASLSVLTQPVVVKEMFSSSSLLLQEKIENYLKQVITQVMKYEEKELDIIASFSEYGIDSLIVLEILKPLRVNFGYLPSTLLFEYPTIAKLASYLISAHAEGVSKLLPVETKKNCVTASLSLRHFILSYLKKIICEVMKIPPDSIEEDNNFSEYGIDSLIVLEVLKPLQKQFGYLPSTLLFEYPNFSKLTDYFLEKQKEAFQKLFPAAIQTISKENTRILEDVNKSLSEQKVSLDDCAIIGMAGIFPEASNIEEFWELLAAGHKGITKVPIERWDWKQFTDESGEDAEKSYTAKGGFIKDIAFFDYQFFNITPLDAEKIDPQERLFLQTTYHAIENAGYTPKKLPRNTGVFIGVMNGGYGWLGIDTKETNDADTLYWSIANRVSYTYDFTAPSMAVDTACSSSLSALHLATQAIRGGECSCAIVGGVNLIIHPRQLTKLCRLRMLSKNGDCNSFGEGADGFVDGEGIISIVIKSLNQALKDEDRIYGIIKGTALNSGGKTSGYTVPNPVAQAEVIMNALKRAHVDSSTISYIEAHGTGTELGDPIEIRGLTKAFGEAKQRFCKIGSVKSNIGHLESAAGLAGLIKILLQIEKKELVPSLHSRNINKHLCLEETPFILQDRHELWPLLPGTSVRRAGLSSFGAGGANAHVIIEEPVQNRESCFLPVYLLPLSGKNSLALQREIDQLRRLLDRNAIDLYSLVYTFSCCKQHFSIRRAIIFQTLEELKNQLKQDLTQLNRNVESCNKKMIEAAIEQFSALETSIEIKQKTSHVIAQAYLSQEEIEWEKLYPKRSVISLPNYPFEKNFCWIKNPGLGFSQRQRYEDHHMIGLVPLLPAAMALSLFVEGAEKESSFSDITWIKPIYNSDSVRNHVKGNQHSIVDAKLSEVIYVQAHLSHKPFPKNLLIPQLLGTEKLKEGSVLYNEFATFGYQYHTTYQRLLWAKVGKNVAQGAVFLDPLAPFVIDPALIDAAMQLAITLNSFQTVASKGTVFVPFMLQNFYIDSRVFPSLAYCFIEIKEIREDIKAIIYDIIITDEHKEPWIYLERLTSIQVQQNALQKNPVSKEIVAESEESVGELQFL